MKIFYDENATKFLEVVYLATMSATIENYRAYRLTLKRLLKCPSGWKPVLDIKTKFASTSGGTRQKTSTRNLEIKERD
jgi:hypothetical protein